MEVYHQELLLPEGHVILEIDMAACHTAFFAGFMGPEKAPHTWGCYQTHDFWATAMEKYGDILPKRLLKRLLYQGLNGGKIDSEKSLKRILNTHMKDTGQNLSLYTAIKAALEHPILKEVIGFQKELIKQVKGIYLPTSLEPYKSDPMKLPSRALVSHELILLGLGYLAEAVVVEGLGLPVSLEHDGLLILCRAEDCPRVNELLRAVLWRSGVWSFVE